MPLARGRFRQPDRRDSWICERDARDRCLVGNCIHAPQSLRDQRTVVVWRRRRRDTQLFPAATPTSVSSIDGGTATKEVQQSAIVHQTLVSVSAHAARAFRSYRSRTVSPGEGGRAMAQNRYEGIVDTIV